MGGNILGIEIGLQNTRICEIVKVGNSHKVVKCVTFETPADTVEDGYVRDKSSFCSELKNVIQKEKFQTNKVIFSIISTKIYTKEVIIPYVKDNKIKEILKTNIQDYLPFSTADYIVNHTVIEKVRNKSEKKIRVLLIAMPENMVKNYYSMAQMAGLDVISLDYSGNSVYQMLRSVPEKGTNVYIQTKEQSTIISILRDRVLVLQRTIAFGTNDIVQAVMERNVGSINDEKEAFELITQEDFVNKNIVAVDQEEVEAAATSERQINVYKTTEAVSDLVNYFVSSISRVMDYYSNQGGTSIHNVFLLGQGASVKGISEYIQREMGIYPQTIKEFHGFKAGKSADGFRKNPTDYLTCLGAVIQPIGFQPRDIVAKKVKRSNLRETVVIVAVSIVGSILLYTTSKVQYKEAKKNLDLSNKILAEMPTGEATQELYDQAVDQLNQVKELDNSTKTNVEQIYELMKVFEDTLVTDVKIDSMQVSGDSISMSVELSSKPAAAKLIQQFDTLTDYFSKINISGITEVIDEDGKTTVTFSVSCIFKNSMESAGESDEEN